MKRLFRIYPLQDDVVFLALWYASHMMPDGLLDQSDLYKPDGIVLATRLFVLSYTLAIKWLADESYLPRHWCVSQACDQCNRLMFSSGFHTTRKDFRFLRPRRSTRRLWNCLITISISLPFNGWLGCTN